MRGMDGIEHRTNVIVRRNFRHAEQSMAIGGLASFFERTLIGEKRLDCMKNNENADRPMSAIE